MGEFGDASLDKMRGVFDLNQKGSKLRYNSFLTSKHMSIFAQFDYAIKYEANQLSSLYLDLLQPKEKEIQVNEKPKKMSKRNSKGKYHWNRVEQKRYIDFLLENLASFQLSSSDRRMMGINSKMSRSIKSRDTNQCRSHHQKMLTKFGSVERVISEHESMLCPRNLKKWNQLCLNGREWKVLQESICSSNESICSFEREKYREKMSQAEVVHFFDPEQHSLIEQSSLPEDELF